MLTTPEDKRKTCLLDLNGKNYDQVSPPAGVVPAVEIMPELSRDRLQVHEVAETAPGALTSLIPGGWFQHEVST